jgi:hypothetical protein
MLPKPTPLPQTAEFPVFNGEKRLRKKRKNPAEDDDDTAKGKPTAGKIKLIRKGNKTLAEIDGELYKVDANGKPTKKLRKKKKAGEDDDTATEQRSNGTPMRQPMRLRPRNKQSHSAGPTGEDERGRPDKLRGGPDKLDPADGERTWTRTVGRHKKMQQDEERRRRGKEAPGEVKREKSIKKTTRTSVDAKGRKVVVDEFGNKTVFDKTGKKLRKKGEKEEKKPVVPELRIGGSKTACFFMVVDGVILPVEDGLYHVIDGLVNLY